MEKKILAVIVVIALLIVFIILPMVDSSDRKSINKWATTNNHVVSAIDRHHFNTGPFWHSKNCRIYKVQTEDGIFWFRFGLFGADIEKYDEE